VNKKEAVLVIDDEESMRDACFQILTRDGYNVTGAGDGVAGFGLVRDMKPDLVLVDLKMPGMSGMDVLEKIRDIDPGIICVVITGYATISSAVESMKRGAYDFLPKPFTPDELRIIVKRGMEKRKLILEAAYLREEKERMREKFVSLVSHQLKTPLTSVQQYLESILSGAVGKTNPQQEKVFHRISERISGLLTLIDKWLSLSRIEAGKLVDKFTSVSLTPILKETVELMSPLAKNKNVFLITELPEQDCVIKGDNEMLKQAFTNLIDNGIKYNLENGRVVVKLTGDQTHFIVDISDTGIGIPGEALPFIFDEFFRVDNSDTYAMGGSGLGLSIVRKIIEAHSGLIKVDSEIGNGSKFSVFLPRSGI
jgi:signal transduction histidine kinase